MARLELLTGSEVRAILNISSATFSRLIATGALPHYRNHPRGKILVARRDLDAYVMRTFLDYAGLLQ